jgi:hypothetical protein
MNELEERISELVIENARIKKTSENRFNQIKELKLKAKSLDVVNSRFNTMKEFLIRHGLPISTHEGRERIDFSVMNSIRGLLATSKPSDSVSTEGLYVVKVNDEYKLAQIKHYICWEIKFINDADHEYNRLHHENVSEFILVNMEKK